LVQRPFWPRRLGLAWHHNPNGGPHIKFKGLFIHIISHDQVISIRRYIIHEPESL
jgi:hypothetical protein